MKPIGRSGTAGLLMIALAVVALAAAGPASAHVTVAAPGVAAGATDAVITFRVPDESVSADTVGLKLQLPTATPIAGVLVAPIPGWSAKITQTTLKTPIKTDDGDITQVVSEIDWTAAAGGGIKPGFFGQFTIIAGKLPDGADSLTFKAVQSYSDKTTVSWIETPAPGSSTEPEHPAPVLELSGGTSSSSSAGSSGVTATARPAASSSAPDTAAASSSPVRDSSSRATTGVVLGALGVALGAAALGLALISRRRRTS